MLTRPSLKVQWSQQSHHQNYQDIDVENIPVEL